MASARRPFSAAWHVSWLPVALNQLSSRHVPAKSDVANNTATLIPRVQLQLERSEKSCFYQWQLYPYYFIRVMLIFIENVDRMILWRDKLRRGHRAGH